MNVLVVAATKRELDGATRVRTLVCGVGPVEAAVHTARELERAPADAVLHVGLAGARTLEPLSIVVGTQAVYEDLGALIPVVERARPDAHLVAVARRALPEAVSAPIGTSARVDGTSACDVEAMEGFGVLRAAERARVPAVEIRIVVNDPSERDRSKWRFAEGLAALEDALPLLIDALAD